MNSYKAGSYPVAKVTRLIEDVALTKGYSVKQEKITRFCGQLLQKQYRLRAASVRDIDELAHLAGNHELEGIARKMLTHPIIRKKYMQLDAFYSMYPLNMARFFEQIARRETNIEDAPFGRRRYSEALVDLAKEEDIASFIRMIEAYAEFELKDPYIQGAPEKIEGRKKTVRGNLEFMCDHPKARKLLKKVIAEILNV